jgi:predicted nucleotidyltransferase
MPRLDPVLERLLGALVRGLQELNVRFCVVGALVQELLLHTPPDVRTNDADVVILVADFEAFDAVKAGLERRGFSRTRIPHRLTYHEGGIADLVPYSRELAPDGKLELGPDTVMNTAGFDHAVEEALHVTLDSGPVVPIVPLPLYALLKLVAYSDRKAQKDIDALEHLLRYYAEDDDRRWGLEHRGDLIDFDYGPAYLLGLDGRTFLDEGVVKAVGPLLPTLSRGAGGDSGDDGDGRARREDLFLWYQRGLGLDGESGKRASAV